MVSVMDDAKWWEEDGELYVYPPVEVSVNGVTFRLLSDDAFMELPTPIQLRPGTYDMGEVMGYFWDRSRQPPQPRVE